MDLNLQAVSATVVFGAYFSIGLVVLVRLIFGVPRRMGKAPWSRLRESVGERLSGVTTTALMLTLFFAVGILVEDLSNKYVDTPGEQWFCLLESEEDLRVQALFGDLEQKELSPLAREWAAAGLLGRYGGTVGASVERAVRHGRVEELKHRPNDTRDVASAAYYRAKNTLYRERTYFDELRAIQQRIDFTRSLTLLSAVLLGLALLFFVVEWVWPGWVGGCCLDLHSRARGRRSHLERHRSRLGSAARRRRRISARLPVILVVLVALCWFARIAYGHEEKEFNLRTYGYFVSLKTNGVESSGEPLSLGISAVAPFSEDELLVVHDTKRQRDCPACGPRIGLLTLHATPAGEPALGPTYRSIDIDWGDHAPANDLEAACALPGHPGRYLVVESSPFEGPARLFQLKVSRKHRDEPWVGGVERVLELPGDVEQLDSIEGLACAATAEDEIALWFCDKWSGGVWSATLRPTAPQGVVLNLSSPRWLAMPPDPGWVDTEKNVRRCSDLYAAPDGTVWASAADDPDDEGSFRSIVYRAGSITNSGFIPVSNPGRAAFVLEGFKVEAVGPDPSGHAELGVGTDDEDYGGAWRPFGPPPPATTTRR